MITLDSTLQARMDSTIRKPLVDIYAKGAVSEIPFLGSLLTTETINEKKSSVINHSSGRMCLVYYFGPDSTAPYYSIKYVYSDIGRTYFTTVAFSNTNYDILGIDLCELANGNIGIVWIENNTGTHQYQLKRKIITVEGAEVSAAAINSWSHDVYTSGPTVVWNSQKENYIMAYVRISGANYYFYQRTSSDFVSWSAEATISVGGLVSTNKLLDPFIRAVTTDSEAWVTEAGTVAKVYHEVEGKQELYKDRFTVTGDKAATYYTGRAIMLDQDSDDYGYVASSSYADGLTTVMVSNATVSESLTGVKYGPASGTSYDLMLVFAVVETIGDNGEELSNIYYSISGDMGATWSTATKITDYSAFDEVANHPVICEKAENQVYLAYNKKRAALSMSYKTSGWPENLVAGSGSDPCNMHFDATNRKLYCINGHMSGGGKFLQSVVKIDVDTWTIENSWTTATTPALSNIWTADNLWWHRDQGAGQYVVLGSKGHRFIQVIDGEANSIKTYAFDNIEAYGITQNVSGYSFVGAFGWTDSSIWHTAIDLKNRRIWILSGSTYLYTHKFEVGWISLDDDGPTYTYRELAENNDWGEGEMAGGGDVGFNVFPDDDFIIVASYESTVLNNSRLLFLFRISTGEVVKKYKFGTEPCPDFPKYGLDGAYYHNRKIYGGITYYNLYGQENYRGLGEIDIDMDIFRCHRPSFASVDNYTLGDMVATSDNHLLISSWDYGICDYNILTDTWETYSNSTIPGLTNPIENSLIRVDYDEATGSIFAGVYGSFCGYVMFQKSGFFLQAQYAPGSKITSWAFEEATPLVSGYVDSDACIVCDPATYGLTAFWTNQQGSEYSIKWGQDNGEFSLNQYLVRGRPITIKRSVDGSPNELSLELSHGHLFDPYNLASAYHSILDKGNLIVVKFGEDIDGTPYYIEAGTFHITSKKLNYRKGEYPTISIEGADKRYIWKDKQIVATDYYDGQDPDSVLIDILEENTPLSVEKGDFDLPAIDDAVKIDVQYTEKSLDDICQEILDRFSYFLKITNTDKVSAGKIATDNPVTHTYSDSDQILEISPQDSFSDYTNRVIVEGQERDYSDVVYDEELVGTLNGTVGWWGFKKDFTIYYSKDKSKRVRNPRLKVVETTTSIGFKLAGNISESLLDNDPNEHYCTVRVEAPSLVPYLLAFIALKEANGMVGDAVAGWGAGWTRPVGTLATNIASIGIMLILGACGNFQYEIYGLPVGEERRSIQSPADDAECNDAECQAKIGYIVEKRIEEPFCYTVAECTQVARNEMAIIKAQRNGISINKITHLQDEEGDTIDFVHPVSRQKMRVFVTDLTREYTIPEGGVAEEASCVDQIEGWVLNQ